MAPNSGAAYTISPTATCAHCHRRIRLFECLWRELDSGAVRASYAVDLCGLQRNGRRTWHVGCYDPMAAPQRRYRSPAVPMIHELCGIYV
jgi:hypothetical protein